MSDRKIRLLVNCGEKILFIITPKHPTGNIIKLPGGYVKESLRLKKLACAYFRRATGVVLRISLLKRKPSAWEWNDHLYHIFTATVSDKEVFQTEQLRSDVRPIWLTIPECMSLAVECGYANAELTALMKIFPTLDEPQAIKFNAGRHDGVCLSVECGKTTIGQMRGDPCTSCGHSASY